jgi:hypothetical protein
LIGFSLACLILWLGFDNNFEHQLRQTLLSDPAQAPPELADIKSVFQQTVGFLYCSFTQLNSNFQFL